MTDKEIARFKVKFPKINLSRERLAELKLNLADDADEATIDAKLDEVNGYMSYDSIAKADDRARQQQAKPTTPPATGSDTPPTDDADDKDTPQWAKTLITQNKTLFDEVNALKAGKTTDSRKTQLDAVLKDAPDNVKKLVYKGFDRASFKDDAEFDAYLEDVKEDAKGFANDQQQQQSGPRGTGKPFVPTGTGGDKPKQATKEELDAVQL